MYNYLFVWSQKAPLTVHKLIMWLVKLANFHFKSITDGPKKLHTIKFLNKCILYTLASCLTLEIKELRCYEAKIKESKKAAVTES